MIKLKDLLSEGKFKAQGKYLYMPGGEVSSIPGNYDRDAIVVGIKNDTFKIYMQNGKLYAAGNKYDKFFKNGKHVTRVEVYNAGSQEEGESGVECWGG